MNRRRFVAAVSAAVATAGCAAAFASGSGPIVDREFAVSDRSDRGTGFFTAAPDEEDEPPNVTFRPAEDRVRVVGRMEVGMPCQEAVLDEAEYDSEADELRVRVGRSEADENCRTTETVDAYRVEVTLEGALPETVVVEEEFPTVIDKTVVRNPATRPGTTNPG